MTGATPPDPGEIRPIGTAGRRWMVTPILVVLALAVAVAKPWGDAGDTGSGTVPSSSAVAAATGGPTSAPTQAASVALPRVIGTAPPAAADVVGSIEIEAAPWANELVADAGGAWAWSDTGTVLRADATTDTLTRIDLGSTADATLSSPWTRGVALAWSQIWAADPAHRGLARIDRDTAAVVERIELWPADDPEPPPSGSGTGGATPDRLASASGFAIDGESIFVPSLAGRPGELADPTTADGALWRIHAEGARPAGWIPLDLPTGVAVGFGSVWVVTCCGAQSDARTYSIVRLERDTGAVQASITLSSLASNADGWPVIRIGWDSVWIGLPDVSVVVRIDPATSSVQSILPTELPVSDIAVGGDGTLWIAESEEWYRSGSALSDRCEGRLVRFDPVDERSVAATTLSCPMSVAVHGNDVWVGTAGTEPSATRSSPPRLMHMRAIDPPS